MLYAKKADFKEIGRACGISQVLARLIRNRDVCGEEETRDYLCGEMRDLTDPVLLPDAGQAVELLSQKLRGGQSIRIFGDYDVDGICSSYILWRSLTFLGAQVDVVLPDRVKDGYGINERMVEQAVADGVDTILTCDNGISAAVPLRRAKEAGRTVIVTDHHEVPFIPGENGERCYVLPEADAIVNPKVVDPQTGERRFPFPDICGAEVAFGICHLLVARERGEGAWEALSAELLAFAGLATVCDVMPLVRDNRILVREGLAAIRDTKNVGLRALIEVTGLSNREITCYHAGFVLGPCLNASGRLDTALRGLHLFQETDRAEALRQAQALKDLNDNRKDMTAAGVREAVSSIESEGMLRDRVLVVFLPTCHESLAGIIAGRIRERYMRPTFVVTRTENGMAKGSGRSIEAYDMYLEMTRVREVFDHFGGHKMAAGFSLPEENIPEMRRLLNENCTLTPEQMTDVLHVDMQLPPRLLTIPLVQEFSRLEPCGTANPPALFVTKDVRVRGARVLGKNQNVVKLDGLDTDGTRLEIICFMPAQDFQTKLSEELGGEQQGREVFQGLLQGRQTLLLHMVYYPEVNTWNGTSRLQMVMKDFRVPQIGG